MKACSPNRYAKSEVSSVVFLTVKSDLGILSGKRIVKEACSAECTWLEFFKTFQVFITHPGSYYILGKGGRTAELNSPVGDYVKTFERPLQVYAVSLEPKSRPIQVASKRIRVKPSKFQNTVTSFQNKKKNPVPRSRPGPLCSKFQAQRSGATPPNPGITQDEQEIVCSPHSEQARSPPILKRELSEQFLRISESTSQGSPYSEPTILERGPSGQFRRISESSSQGPYYIEQARSPPILKREPSGQFLRISESSSKGRGAGYFDVNRQLGTRSATSTPHNFQAFTNENSAYKRTVNSPGSSNPFNGGISIHPVDTLTETQPPQMLNFNHVSLNNVMDSQDSTNSSRRSNLGSQDEVFKSYAINFLTRKVSNEDMKIAHQEVMKLKQNGDYFQLTRIAPLAAGLLEQLLCPPMMYLERQMSDAQADFR